MYFIAGIYWETNPEKTIFDKITFHGTIEQDGEPESDNIRNGKIIDDDGVISFITQWNWNKQDKTLKFLATTSGNTAFPTFYHLTEKTPQIFEGNWEAGTKEKARIIITTIPDGFFEHDIT